MNNEKLTLGLVGYGYWGKNLLRTLVENKEVEHIIVCDTNEKELEKLKEKYKDKVTITPNYDYLLSIPQISGVLIATPPDSHYDLAIRSIKAGKNTFVEKPATSTELQAMILCGMASKRNLTLMTGHTFCYVEAVQEIKRRIIKGELGDIKYISWNQLNLGKYQTGGVLKDLSPHGISIAMYLLDNPSILKVRSDVHKSLNKNLIDIGHIDIYTDKAFIHISNSWIHPQKVRNLVVVGTKKTATYNDITTVLQLIDSRVEEADQMVGSTWGETKMNYIQGDILIPKLNVIEPLKREIQEFIDCIKTGKEPLSGKSQILKVAEIMDQIV